jgi:hypothetical protein
LATNNSDYNKDNEKNIHEKILAIDTINKNSKLEREKEDVQKTGRYTYTFKYL